MKKLINISLLSLSILIPLHINALNFNPLKWGKTDKSQENLIKAIEQVAKKYQPLIELTLTQLAKAPKNPESEEEMEKIMHGLQCEVIAFINKAQTVPAFLVKKLKQQDAKSTFPYLTYSNDLNNDLQAFQSVIESYMKNTPEKNQNEQLIQAASEIFLIMQAVLESLSKAPEVLEEAKTLDKALQNEQADASTQTDVSTSTNSNQPQA